MIHLIAAAASCFAQACIRLAQSLKSRSDQATRQEAINHQPPRCPAHPCALLCTGLEMHLTSNFLGNLKFTVQNYPRLKQHQEDISSLTKLRENMCESKAAVLHFLCACKTKMVQSSLTVPRLVNVSEIEYKSDSTSLNIMYFPVCPVVLQS